MSPPESQESTKKVTLDATDHRILGVLQQDASLSNQDLAAAVKTSHTRAGDGRARLACCPTRRRSH